MTPILGLRRVLVCGHSVSSTLQLPDRVRIPSQHRAIRFDGLHQGHCRHFLLFLVVITISNDRGLRSCALALFFFQGIAVRNGSIDAQRGIVCFVSSIVLHLRFIVDGFGRSLRSDIRADGRLNVELQSVWKMKGKHFSFFEVWDVSESEHTRT